MSSKTVMMPKEHTGKGKQVARALKTLRKAGKTPPEGASRADLLMLVAQHRSGQ